MMATERVEFVAEELDAVAWRFLRSEFASHIYADWPIDRRVEAFLQHSGPSELLNDGSAYSSLMDHVMANIGPALRYGVLSPTMNALP